MNNIRIKKYITIFLIMCSFTNTAFSSALLRGMKLPNVTRLSRGISKVCNVRGYKKLTAPSSRATIIKPFVPKGTRFNEEIHFFHDLAISVTLGTAIGAVLGQEENARKEAEKNYLKSKEAIEDFLKACVDKNFTKMEHLLSIGFDPKVIWTSDAGIGLLVDFIQNHSITSRQKIDLLNYAFNKLGMPVDISFYYLPLNLYGISNKKSEITLLNLAMLKEQADLAHFLLDKGAKLIDSKNSATNSLYYAIMSGDAPLVQRVVKIKNYNLNHSFPRAEKASFTPLELAVVKSPSVIRVLVELGVDINAPVVSLEGAIKLEDHNGDDYLGDDCMIQVSMTPSNGWGSSKLYPVIFLAARYPKSYNILVALGAAATQSYPFEVKIEKHYGLDPISIEEPRCENHPEEFGFHDFETAKITCSAKDVYSWHKGGYFNRSDFEDYCKRHFGFTSWDGVYRNFKNV